VQFICKCLCTFNLCEKHFVWWSKIELIHVKCLCLGKVKKFCVV
jgi:hypothetical protein